MSAPPTIERDDRRALRQFALLFAGLVALLFFGVLPWLFDYSRPSWPLVVATALATLGVLWPPGVYPVYRAWMPLASAVGWFNTRLILGLAFVLMIVPLGVLLRRLGKLQYRGGTDSAAVSYRVKRTVSPTRTDMDNPF